MVASGQNTSFGPYNTGYTAHSVRQISLRLTSYSPKTLYAIPIQGDAL